MWQVVFTKQAQKDAKKLSAAGLRPKAEQLTEILLRKEFSIIEEISPEDFGNPEDEMPMRDGLDQLLTEPFAECNHSLLVAGWAEVSALAREGQPTAVHLL